MKAAQPEKLAAFRIPVKEFNMQTSTHVQTPLRSTRVPTRTRQLADAHSWAHKAGFDTKGEVGDPKRERYERELMKVAGVPSLRRASREQRVAVIDHFRKMTDGAYRITNARPVAFTPDSECEGVL